jgi:hypothetical protein
MSCCEGAALVMPNKRCVTMHLSALCCWSQGCTVYTPAGVRCPQAAPYFRAQEDGTLNVAAVSEIGATDSFCSVAPPLNNACPANLGGVPVRDATVAGDSNKPVLGCLGEDALFDDNTCPTTVPAAGAFTFPVVAGSDLGTATRGNIVECIRSGSTCGGLVPFRTTTSSPVRGCISLLGTDPCPREGWIAGEDYGLTLYRPISATDALAVAEACIAAAGQKCPATHLIQVREAELSTTTPADGSLLGCAAANTACPRNFWPLIDTSLKVTACREQSTCPTGFIPLCDNEDTPIPQSTGVCADTETKGCIATTLQTTWQVCSRLAGTATLARYPSTVGTASQYKFIGKLQPGGTYALVGCSIQWASANYCWAAGGVPGAFTQEAYPAGEQ